MKRAFLDPCGLDLAQPSPSRSRTRQRFQQGRAQGLLTRATWSAIAIGSIMISLALPAVSQAPSAGAQDRQRLLEAQLAEPRPIDAVDSVWIEDLTWMEVRDALKAGKTTAIVSSGGVEQNGPYLVTGKHNVILEGSCEGIARALGDALCAPVIKLVPEGDIDPPTGHMLFPGTLTVRQETYRAVLEDVAGSLVAHGFKHIVFIGDSGGNQEGMKIVAAELNQRWKTARVHFIPEYYRYEELFAWLGTGLGVKEPVDEGLHDNYSITAMMMTIDPSSVRYEQRKKANKATINGVAIDPVDRTLEIGRKLMERKIDEAVAAIRKARTAH